MTPRRSRTDSLRNSAYSSKQRSSSISRNVRSPSPTFSETTNVSAMNFGVDGPSKIITRSDLKASVQAYERLMDSCANYRMALVTMSQATALFADAMEVCSGLKGPTYETGTRLQAASGLHHLFGNHYHVLAETLDRNFEKPLRQHFDTYRTIMTERSTSYERALREKSEIIKQTEKRNMNRKERNLQSFREALVVLQRQVDDLDELKENHYQEIMEHEEEVWDVVQGKVCLVVRSTLDVFDRFTSKASDPVIEPMLQTVPDPFDSYGPPQSEDQIFSILPPLSIMPTAPSSTASPTARTPEPDGGVEGLPTSSSNPFWMQNNLNPNPNTVAFPSESSEWAQVPSSPPSSPTATTPTSSTSCSPPARTHNSRKSEPKLRSVLSVIDESRPRHSSNPSNPSSSLGGSTLDGGSSLIQPQPQKKPSFSWATPFSYGQSTYDPMDDEDSKTPRNSTFLPETPNSEVPSLTSTSPGPEPPQIGSGNSSSEETISQSHTHTPVPVTS
ncbi:hypothetical protein D9758_001265 [Tetrapyrgos nigripes]|uniref:IMD domain-containing protein n=1 Tax=Tetrapyrgos nigripes TaxID=182062 RepID=A0A8H5LUI7_9AGAR|nr:hypothetical protein D9758_001265 [Tetrapyrgos nigripes]